jgi:hypothetical protein
MAAKNKCLAQRNKSRRGGKATKNHGRAAPSGCDPPHRGAKADHIRTDWQDTGLARMWQNNANKLDRCAVGLTRIYGDPE